MYDGCHFINSVYLFLQKIKSKIIFRGLNRVLRSFKWQTDQSSLTARSKFWNSFGSPLGRPCSKQQPSLDRQQGLGTSWRTTLCGRLECVVGSRSKWPCCQPMSSPKLVGPSCSKWWSFSSSRLTCRRGSICRKRRNRFVASSRHGPNGQLQG